MSKARQLADLGNVYDDGALSNRNLIINGAANIQQRSAGTIVTSGSIYGPDRFRFATANMDNLSGTFTQNSDAPEGFGNSIKVTITTAESAIAADEYAYINQHVEAQNLQQLAYGTSAAKQVTLSFYVKSSVTGTFAVGLYKADNTAQIHNLTYTISSANTWEYKTVTFAANTLSGGEIDNDNGSGLSVNWHLAAGSDWKGGSSTSGWTSYANNTWADGHVTDTVITTTNATFQLTGVQLECSDTATPFEHRSYGDELQRCFRYYEQWDCVDGENIHLGTSYNGQPVTAIKYIVRKRASPTITLPTAGQTSGTISFLNGTGGYPTTTGTHSTSQVNNRGARIASSGYSGITSAQPAMLYTNGSTIFKFDAEL